MRIYMLSLLLVAALGVESASDEQGEEDLYVYDDFGNLVKLEYNESDASIPWPTRLDVTDAVKFFLHPRPGSEVEIFINDVETLRKSGFDPSLPTVVITHGWQNSKDSVSCTSIRDAIFQRGRGNIIIVDWSKISKSKYYPSAARGVLSVGKRVAEMIDFLQKNGMKLDVTVMIGHSLGAHVVGLAGYYSKEIVNYVVGLDPARPLFSSRGPGERISTEDAKYVEVMHTNAGRLGLESKLGTADFYPNGGRKQPDCGWDVLWTCSHSRAYLYYAESIVTEEGFWGRKCEGPEIQPDPTKCTGELGLMGSLREKLKEKGSYYVPTNGVPPYAQGKPKDERL